MHLKSNHMTNNVNPGQGTGGESKEFDHPKNDRGRYECSKEHPMPEQRPKDSRWSHPEAKEIAEDYGKGGGVADGDYIKFQCPHCKHTWWEELPN